MIIIIPIKKNDEYILNIEALSSEGNGIGRIDGFTIFVPNTIEGDVSRVKIVKIKSSYGYGKLIEIIQESDKRQEPECANFDKCGGCQLMHLKYCAQLEFKRDIIENSLKRIGGFTDIKVDEIIGAENSIRYRNKMIFPVGENDNEVEIGFYAERSHRIIPVDDCKLGDEICKDILIAVKEYMKEAKISAYDEERHIGIIRRVFIRKGDDSGEIMVVISANAIALPEHNILVDKLCAVSDRIVSIVLNCNQNRTNLVLGEKNVTIWGKDRIKDTLCGSEYQISPHSFFQVNPSQTENLYNKAIEFANLKGNETVLDIYCGIGTISLYAASKAKKVIGVEIVEQAIEDARENAIVNNVNNCEFYADSADEIVPKLISDGVRPDVVILDPPRKGSDEKTLDAIVRAQPDRIVYVSCNAATLARDARFLADRGYRIEKVVGVDMFPHTVHVESVVLMSRVDK